MMAAILLGPDIVFMHRLYIRPEQPVPACVFLVDIAFRRSYAAIGHPGHNFGKEHPQPESGKEREFRIFLYRKGSVHSAVGSDRPAGLYIQDSLNINSR
jgi:hypothetical protein